MEKIDNNWLKNPTKGQILIVLLAWIIGNGLLIMAMTDLFTESPFKSRYTTQYFLMIGSSIATFKAVKNYVSNNAQASLESE